MAATNARPAGLSGALALIVAAAVLVPAAAQQPPQGRFRSAVNLLALDVQVIDRNGDPLIGLLPDDFIVSINHRERRVASAELVHFGTTTTTTLPNIGPAAPISTPGAISPDSRVFVLAIDDASFATGAMRPALLAAQRFLRNLRPADMAGVYRFPYEPPQVDITHDHEAVARSLDGPHGRREDRIDAFALRPSEIIDITAGDNDVVQRVARRECSPDDGNCPGIIRSEASMAAAYYETDAAQRLYSLGALIQDLGRLPGHKNVILISGGLLATNRVGGRPDVRGFMTRLGEQAARANVTTYVLHMDDTFNELTSVARPPRRPTDQANSLMADGQAFASGLENLAGETGGVYLATRAGTGDLAFGRVLKETLAYYLVGVEPGPEDLDGRKLMVEVKTRAKGATVRALREVIAR